MYEYIGLYVKHPLFISDFNETWIFRQFSETYSNTKFYENPFFGSRIDSCGQTDRRTERQMDGHDETSICFRSFANALKKKLNGV